MAKCKLCNKEASKLKELFGKMVCRKCIEEYEETSDRSDLSFIIRKRGKKWVEKRLMGLTNKI